MIAFLNRPAVHFVVLGMCLFAARSGTGVPTTASAREAKEAIVIDAARLDELRRDYASTMGKAPDQAAHAYIVDREIDDELLYREALALGLHRADRTVYWRLVEKMEFLDEAREGESDEELFRRALDIGLVDKDPIIRRVLIRKLGMLIRFNASEPPNEADLRSYYDRHPQLYVQPGRATLAHAFFSRDRRGDRARTDARRALESLSGTAASAGALVDLVDSAYFVERLDGAQRGDPFLAGTRFVNRHRDALAKMFGPGFADEVMRAPLRTWHGPIESAFGFHLVWVGERTAGDRLPLVSVRSQVLQAVEEERRDARLRAKLAELRAHYEIRVEAAPAEARVDG